MRSNRASPPVEEIVRPGAPAFRGGVEAECYTQLRWHLARAIADDAGVSFQLISYYFGSKEDLWRATVDHLFERYLETGKGLGFTVTSNVRFTPEELALIWAGITHVNIVNRRYVELLVGSPTDAPKSIETQVDLAFRLLTASAFEGPIGETTSTCPSCTTAWCRRPGWQEADPGRHQPSDQRRGAPRARGGTHRALRRARWSAGTTSWPAPTAGSRRGRSYAVSIPSIQWAKLEALAAGARPATEQLWTRADTAA